MYISYLLVVIIAGIVSVNSSKCQTWRNCSSNEEYQCGSDFNGRLIYHENCSIDISAGFCITYKYNTSDKKSALVVGDCAYGALSNVIKRKYSRLPTNVAHVNSSQCGPYQRKGLFCGECEKGYGPAVYSFNLHCANCSHMSSTTAISLYLLIELIPITIFFFVVLVFRFNLMTGPILGYVTCCQSIINTLQYSRYLYSSLFYNLPLPLVILGHLSLVISGIWNLEFFRFLVPQFCISEKISEIQLQMLGFISSIYPLFLVIISYSAIELNARYGFVSRCIRFNSNYNMRHSIIHAFATFTMLSMFKTMCQGYAILQTTTVLDLNGSVLSKVLFCDPNVEMYSRYHLPYLVTSLIIVFVFLACPALFLCVYPTRLYLKITPFISTRKQLSLKIFAETVHSGFKNGLNNTRDHRMLPGVIILLALIFSLSMSSLPHYGFDGFAPFTISLIFAVSSYIVSFLLPCKSLLTNMSLSFHLLLIGALSLLAGLWWQDIFLKSEVLASWIVVLSSVPHGLMLAWILYNNCHSPCLRFTSSTIHRVSQSWNCIKDDGSRLHEMVTDTDNETRPLLLQ